MSTSLSEQLKRYAKPQTSNLERGKARPSLLFDHKEAAGLRKEVFYEIGLRGLEELITKNELFEQFTGTLFSLESRDFERSIESASANVQLNKHINKFLLLLSPFLSFDCSIKALEWLIYRYSIHQYNKEDLLMLVLPYHNTRIFQKTVDLIRFNELNDPWIFLKSSQKAGTPLTKLQLINHATSDPYFIQFISNFMLKIIKVCENPNIFIDAFSFYGDIFIGAIEYSKETPSESIIIQMIPAILQGLNSQVLNFRAATLAIVAPMMKRCTLSDVVLDKFVQKITSNDGTHLRRETVFLIVIIYQGQSHYKSIPEDALAEIIAHTWFPKTLQELNSWGTYIYPFLEVLIRAVMEDVIKNEADHYKTFLIDLLDQIDINEENIASTLITIIDSVPSKIKEQQGVRMWISELIGKIEKQYPSQFDQLVYKILTSTENEVRKKRLQKIFKGGKLQKKFDIFNKLYDSNALIRIEAIKYISKNFDDLRIEEKDNLRISLEHRLSDDNLDVVKEALGIIGNTKIIQGVELNKWLFDLLFRCHKDKNCRGKILVKCLKLLCISENANNLNVVSMIFPFLLPKTSEEIAIAKQIISSDLFLNCSLFKSFNSKACLDVAGAFPEQLFKCLKAPGKDKTIIDFFQNTDNETVMNFSSVQKYSIAILISNIAHENFTLGDVLPLIEILEKLSPNNDQKSTKTDCSVLGNLKIAKKGHFPIFGYLECILNIITYIGKLDIMNLDFQSSSPVSKFLLSTSSILYHEGVVYQEFIDKFNNSIFHNFDATVDILLHLAVYKKNNIVILNILKKKLECHTLSGFFNLSNKYVVYLLILLTSIDEEIRKKVFEIGKIVMKYSSEKKSYFSLFKYLMEHQEEVVLDSNQLPIIVSNTLNSKENMIIKKDITDTLVNFCYNLDNPLYLVAGVTKVLSGVNNIIVLEKLSSMANSILYKKSISYNESESNIISNCIYRFEESIAKKIKKDSDTSKFLLSTLSNDKDCLSISGESISPSLLAMKFLSESFFSSLSEEIKSGVLDAVIEVSSTPQNPNILLASNKIFKHINLNVNLIIPQLVRMVDAQSLNISSSKKRKRTSLVNVPTIDILENLDWKKGVRVLELIQDKKKLFNVESLLPQLFSVLRKCLQFDEQAAVEYPKQLILSLILNCFQKLENVRLPENNFDMELIVQCFNASSNPQTHHHALLVLTHYASEFPAPVLSNIMAIFTFMGNSSVLRHDDNYSFQLIFGIMDSVVPKLVRDGSNVTIISVLRVFVDAILDVPEHRRLKLYKRLLQKIDPDKHLYLFLILICLSANSLKKTNTGDNPTIKLLNIAIEVVMEFHPSVGLNACKTLIQILKKFPINKEDMRDIQFFIDISDLSEKQFRHFKYTILSFIHGLISSKEFVKKTAELPDEDLEILEPHYGDIIVEILMYIQKTHSIVDKNTNPSLAHYWKTILLRSFEILDYTIALLTPEMFLLVLKGLMCHNLSSIRKRSLDILNSRLQDSSFIKKCDNEELHSTTNSLIEMIKMINSDINEDEMIVVQTALLSLKLIVKAVASNDKKNYVMALEFITNTIKSQKAQGYVLSSLILCLAELCVSLREEAIEHLPTFMPVLLRILKQEKHQDHPTLLCLSLLTTIQKIFEVLPGFISRYLKKLLFEISQLNGKWTDATDDPKLSQFVQKLKIIKLKLAENIEPRILIPAIEECYSDIINKNKLESISPIMGILSEHIKRHDISPQIKELKQFFIDALEFRNLDLCDMDQLNVIEDNIINALITFVQKLTDKIFKTFFNSIFRWAEDGETKNNRIITFYKLTCGLAGHLKSLFVLFAGMFVDNAAKILDACNKKKSTSLYYEDQNKNILLLENVLRTLKLVFEHTTRKFINKERFNILMQPIVDNLENDFNGIADLESRNNEILTPCIVNFVVAAADDSLWKLLNYQILMKLRNSNYKIRLISLKCLTEVVKKLGEDFLSLLPETIPFLSELLEDDHEVVQQHCRKSIQELEEVLGENLTKYF